jgi:vitamin B12 transporter
VDYLNVPERYDFCLDFYNQTSNSMKNYLLYAFLLSPLPALAQIGDTTKLNEITISENRLKTPFNKLARNIQFVTKEEIASLPVKSINEVLSYIGGVDVRQRGPFGTQADISIDGGTFEQTLILLNGVKISDAQTAHHSMNIPVPLAAIERIEILKGPAARIYGINALTGAINIVTTSAIQSTLTISAQGGSSFETKDIREGDGKYGGAAVEVVVNLAGKENQHLFAVGSDNYNGQRYNSATHADRLFYQGKLDFNNKHSVNATAGYITNAFGASGYYAAPGDIEAFEEVKTAMFGLGSVHQLSPSFSIKPRLSARYNWDDYRYFRNDLNRARSLHQTAIYAAELNSTLQTTIGDFGFGLETRSEDIESTNIGNRHRNNHGAYAEYKNDLWKALTLNVGAYANYNTQFGWQVFPGLDVAYSLNSYWKLAFNVGSSHRIPSFTDLYLNQRPGNIGNPNLKSENAWQYEGSLQYRNGGFRAQGGYFFRTISNFIDWIRNSSAVPYQPQNFGENKVQGYNVSLLQLVKISDKASLSYHLSYHYLMAENTMYANNLSSKYVLEHLKQQGLARIVFTTKPISLSLANRWIERVNSADYIITDLRLAYGINGYNIYAEATNLFNKEYVEIGTVPLPKRWFALGANLKLKL